MRRIFEFSPQERVKLFEEEMNILLLALGCNPETTCLSDESAIGDFINWAYPNETEEEYKANHVNLGDISKAVGIQIISEGERLVDVAAKMFKAKYG